MLIPGMLMAVALATVASPGHAEPDGDDGLRRAAAANEMTVSELREVLRDPSAHLSGSGRIYYADPIRPSGDRHNEPSVRSLAAPLARTFDLHSNPGAQRTIFLDFDGHTVSGTQWNTDGLQSRFYAGWDPANNGAAFNAAELAKIQKVWQWVAEDYAPFNVDVTTDDPGEAAIDRAGSGDQVFGTRALFTDDAHAQDATCGSCAGVAFLGAFDDANNHARFQPAFIFPGSQSDKALAETTSHETGHNFTLQHDGKGGVEYYGGHQFWAPVMGFSDFEPITTWSNGAYGGTSSQDDVQLINTNGAPFRPDEAPSSVAGSPTVPSGSAYITSRSDKDVYALGQCSGAVTVSAQPAAVGANLDIELRLLDSGGSTVSTANPLSQKVNDEVASGLNASINQSVMPGTYYAQVDGIGRGAPATSYDDYGSIGAYTLQVTGCGGVVDPGDGPPSAPLGLTGDYLGDGDVQLNWAAPADDGAAPVTSYNVYMDGDSVGSVSAGPALSAIVDNVPPGVHDFGVAAVNSEGPGPQAHVPVDATDQPPNALPGKARIGSAKSGAPGGGVTVKIKWRPPTVAATPPIDRYQVVIYKLNRRGKYVQLNRESFAGSTRAAKFTQAHGTFKFAVRAHNRLGYGRLSAKSNAATGR